MQHLTSQLKCCLVLLTETCQTADFFPPSPYSFCTCCTTASAAAVCNCASSVFVCERNSALARLADSAGSPLNTIKKKKKCKYVLLDKELEAIKQGGESIKNIFNADYTDFFKTCFFWLGLKNNPKNYIY